MCSSFGNGFAFLWLIFWAERRICHVLKTFIKLRKLMTSDKFNAKLVKLRLIEPCIGEALLEV